MINTKLHILSDKSTIKDALDSLNLIAVKNYQTLFIVDANNKLIGTLTDGDIRRGLLKGLEADENVYNYINTNFRSLQVDNYTTEQIQELNTKQILLVPLLSKGGEIIRIIDVTKEKFTLPIEAFIMAGGKGERLMPLTENTPKPLLIIGDKPIIEHNIDRLTTYGIDKIHI